MNYLVFLDAREGELGKILSGIKTMILKEVDQVPASYQQLSPGDSLYFLRNRDESATRVQATVVRVLFMTDPLGDDLSQILKEMQSGLQLTEDQYNYWSVKKQVLMVEFSAARKIPAIPINRKEVTGQTDWIAFERARMVATSE